MGASEQAIRGGVAVGMQRTGEVGQVRINAEEFEQSFDVVHHHMGLTRSSQGARSSSRPLGMASRVTMQPNQSAAHLLSGNPKTRRSAL
jgi:hypothetical protein